ncbi:uncharacterized protein Bfra_002529 [Botrytis fragariae]|uniref:Uncharacterized protein n=1 Tax=Botrytis fragariae TaxID=1964551 RepID=A0A8H6AYL3_9HELO|nr:uncharacterized protein Bfra_002529 [Botrytis fragariae]KAF5876129.1 hypothetical protein Bfra_002529 [Botrytis fragariae]
MAGLAWKWGFEYGLPMEEMRNLYIHTITTEYYSRTAKVNLENPAVLRSSFHMQPKKSPE